MAAYSTMLLVWLWLGLFGYLAVRRIFGTGDPWLLVGAAVPVALTFMAALFLPSGLLLDHPRGWIVGSLALFVATVVLVVKRETVAAGEVEEFGFSPFAWGVFMTLLTAANVITHTAQVTGPEADFGLEFALVSLLHEGEPLSLLYPLVAEAAGPGTFGWLYLLAALGMYAGGGAALLSTAWVLHHILLAAAFFLAFSVGRRGAGTAGGFFAVLLLFFGFQGESAGLMEVSESELLSSALILTLLAVLPARKTVPAGLTVLLLGTAATFLLWGSSVLVPLQLFLMLLLAVSLGRFFKPGGARRAVAVVLVAWLAGGGLVKVNRTLMATESMTPEERATVFSPFYPEPRAWLVGTARLELTDSLARAAEELNFRARPGERMLLDVGGHGDQVAALVGLAGLAVPEEGHGTGLLAAAPSPDWERFWRTGSPDLASVLGARWLLTSRPETASVLAAEEAFKKMDEFDSVVLWRYTGRIAEGREPL